MTTTETIIDPNYQGPRLRIILQPENKILLLPRVKTVSQLLDTLNIAVETALVVRDGQLLTYDRHLYPDEEILVRKVGSRG